VAAKAKKSVKSDGWSLFDRVVATAPLRSSSPWQAKDAQVLYAPDYETLKLLLRVPWMLGSRSTSGLPALALDVWTAYELRRAGFESDAVWPRADTPRVLPGPIANLLANLPKTDAARLRELLASGKTFGGTVGASAKVLGKNYLKQVDVVISDWDTGPEVLISTKRMDDSYGNNAPNRMEESYGDAKNLRSRHPRAAIGFVFSLNANAFVEAPRVADWILDLLAKLGREDDAYDAVALVVPRYPTRPKETAEKGPEEEALEPDAAVVQVELLPPTEEGENSVASTRSDSLFERLRSAPAVDLALEKVPDDLAPARFLEHVIRHVMDNSPITRHDAARRLFASAEADARAQRSDS
jgi:hypothetical protein